MPIKQNTTDLQNLLKQADSLPVIEITQSTGTSETSIMSQKAVTEELGKISEKVVNINNNSETVTEQVTNIVNKLDFIEENAQENKIESIKLGDEELEIVNKTVKIPVGAGLKLSDEFSIGEDGTVGIGNIGISKLVDDGTLILDGGSSSFE